MSLHRVPFRSLFGSYLSELEVKDDRLIVPRYLQEDCDLGEEYPISEWKKVQRRRVNAFRECKYTHSLPFVPFLVSSKLRESPDEVKEWMEKHISTHPFVKTCEFSPKDLGSCIFTTVEHALKALHESKRTANFRNRHVVMKVAREFTQQLRCFWVFSTLRYVISKSKINREKVLAFFQEHRFNFPTTCCIEVGVSEHGYEIIEMNAFGPDLICDPAPLVWTQDWEKIYLDKNTRFLEL
jgi:hypothetical protein